MDLDPLDGSKYSIHLKTRSESVKNRKRARVLGLGSRISLPRLGSRRSWRTTPPTNADLIPTTAHPPPLLPRSLRRAKCASFSSPPPDSANVPIGKREQQEKIDRNASCGRLGSYISRSVYTVSGPFHPFGGAVDIIVVEQPDGSYKSSPWYVRFGKFQGVLKTREKMVSISVNGVEADFQMYLNHKGEAVFLKEVDEENGESVYSPPSSSGEDTDKQPGKRRSTEEKGEENASDVVRTESLERAEIAADLLDLKWSTNLASPRCKKDNNASRFSAVDALKDENLPVDGCGYDETGLISRLSYQEQETVEENAAEMKYYVVETATSVESVDEDNNLSNSEKLMTNDVSVVSEVAKSDSQIQDSVEKLNDLPDSVQNMTQSIYDFQEPLDIQQCIAKGNQFSFVHEERISVNGGPTNGASESIVTEYSELVSLHQSNDSHKDIDSQSVTTASSLGYLTCSPVEEQIVLGEDEASKHGSSVGPLCNPPISICDILESRISEEEQLLFGDLDDFGSTDAKQLEFRQADHERKETDSSFSSKVADGVNESSDAKCFSNFSLDQSVITDYINDDNLLGRRLRSISSDVCINKADVHSKELTRMVRSLPSMGPLCNNLEASDRGHSFNPSLYPGVDSCTDNHQIPSDQTSEDVKIPQESEEGHANLPIVYTSRLTPGFLCGDGTLGVISDVDGTITRMEKPYQMDLSSSPQMASFLLYSEKDIKALFPADTNPFYAGFGNRDTDEFSYLKVGIPRGKIFIINPKVCEKCYLYCKRALQV
ncbi:hypothetical protein DH2020_004105 [Rehmannia glutinosa]|uniref:LNS2/PITP domain-containing protein n=1 Tax=Rehmannia glutinosa TaxID=99300 RepID=A0ABR0XNL2_REHGL